MTLPIGRSTDLDAAHRLPHFRWSGRGVTIVREREHVVVGQITALAGSIRDPADAALESLERFAEVVPYVGVALSAWDPLARRHRVLGQVGYPDDVLAYLNDGYFRLDPAYRMMQVGNVTQTRWRDTPFDYRESYSVQCVFGPAGYKEGLTAYLMTADRCYAGAFHVSTDSPQHPSDAACTAIGALRPVFANICDGMRGPSWLAESVAPSAHAVALATTGELLPMPGRSGGPWLVDESPLVANVRRRCRRNARFLWEDVTGGWHRVHVLPIGEGVVVCETPTPLPHALTRREIDVLSLIAGGWSNRKIGETLFVTPRTVATHIEHLLEKLDCSNRAALAARAVEEGLVGSHLA
jgi:DNA-binding CsgD family transcriptional regulator